MALPNLLQDKAVLSGLFAIIGVFVGGLFALAGSVLGKILEIRFRREGRMEEVIAEKKVSANQEAYDKITRLGGMRIASSPEQVYVQMMKWDNWFFRNRLFLPGEFPDKWLSLRKIYMKIKHLESREDTQLSEIDELNSEASRLEKEAINEIYKEMKLKKIEIK